MKLIPDEAIATIVAVDKHGSDHQVPGTMAVYSYEPDPADPELWHLTEIDREGDGSLRVDADGQKISIYGTSTDNIHNANNIASMLGWKSCQLFARDSAGEQECLRQLVNVQVLNAPAATLSAPPPAITKQKAARGSAPPPATPGQQATLIDVPPELAGAPEDGDRDINLPEMAPQTGALASVTRAIEERAEAEVRAAELDDLLAVANEKLGRLEQHCRTLEQENQRLRADPGQGATEGQTPSSALFTALLQFAELQLADRIQSAASGADPLLDVLRSHGFGLSVRIVQAQSR